VQNAIFDGEAGVSMPDEVLLERRPARIGYLKVGTVLSAGASARATGVVKFGSWIVLPLFAQADRGNSDILANLSQLRRFDNSTRWRTFPSGAALFATDGLAWKSFRYVI
jgi:hypothetical protein